MVSVWLLIYDHKHGTDIDVHATAASAEAGIICLLQDYGDDDVQRLIADGRVGEALAAHAAGGREYIHVEERSVQNLITAVEELADAASDDE